VPEALTKWKVMAFAHDKELRSELFSQGTLMLRVVIQVSMFLAIPLIALERVAEAAEARHRPLRATYVIAVVYIAHLQGLGGLSTIEKTTDPEEWGQLGAYLLIGGLIAVLGTLSAIGFCGVAVDFLHARLRGSFSGAHALFTLVEEGGEQMFISLAAASDLPTTITATVASTRSGNSSGVASRRGDGRARCSASSPPW